MGIGDEVRKLINAIIGENLRPKDVENDRVEFKSWPLTKEGHCDRKSISDFVSRYSVCFANSSGGILVFGLNNEKFGKDSLEGCLKTEEIDLKSMIYETTRPHIKADVEKVEYMGLIFMAARIPKGKGKYSTSDAKRYHRIGAQCLPMYPDDDVINEVAKGGDYTSKYIGGVLGDAIDKSEVARIRMRIGEKDKSGYNGLSDEDFLIALGLGERTKNGTFRPNIAGLLLAAKATLLKDLIPQAEIAVIALRTDTEAEKEEFIRLPLLAALDRVVSLVEPHNSSVTVRTGLFEIRIPRVPEVVLREGLLNALSHRDYTSKGTVFVRLHPNRTEIANPGGFLEGITPDNILHHLPCPRNRTLAEALQKIGLVNRAGLGVDRMYQVLLENGKEPPIYVAKPDSVDLKILHEVNESFARFCSESMAKGTTYGLDEILILKYLCRTNEIDIGMAATICQRSQTEAREVLNKMTRDNLIDKRGPKRGRGQYYCLAKKVCDQLGERVEYSREKGIDEIRHPEMVMSYLRDHGFIRNRDCQELCEIDRYRAIGLLGKLRSDGKIELRSRGRGAHYVLSPQHVVVVGSSAKSDSK